MKMIRHILNISWILIYCSVDFCFLTGQQGFQSKATTSAASAVGAVESIHPRCVTVLYSYKSQKSSISICMYIYMLLHN